MLSLVSCSKSSSGDVSGLIGADRSTPISETEEAVEEVIVAPDAAHISSFIEPVNGTYADGGGTLLFQVNFSKLVTVSGAPRLVLNIGGVTKYATGNSGSKLAGLEFSYGITSGDNDGDGVEVSLISIDLNGGSIVTDENSLDAEINFGKYLDNLSSVLVNTSSGIIAPGQVSEVTTAPTTDNSVLSVAWSVPTDSGTSIINYTVQYREQGQSTWTTKSPAPTTNQTSINGLIAGTTYEIRVAGNNGLLGAYSSVSTVEIFDVLSLNPIAWLSATDITNGGSEPNHGDKIDRWSDLTGLATDAVESNTTNQPTYHTNVQNGLPAIRFDGTQDRGLQGTFVRNNNDGLTIILVAKMDTNNVRKAFFEFHQQGSPTGGSSSRRGFFFTYGFGVAGVNHNLDDTGFNTWVAYDTGSQSSLWENGVNKYSNVNNYFGRTDFSGNGVYVLGDDQTGGDRLSGYIGEFLVFDKQLTSAELATVQNYIKNKWGTP